MKTIEILNESGKSLLLSGVTNVFTNPSAKRETEKAYLIDCYFDNTNSKSEVIGHREVWVPKSVATFTESSLQLKDWFITKAISSTYNSNF